MSIVNCDAHYISSVREAKRVLLHCAVFVCLDRLFSAVAQPISTKLLPLPTNVVLPPRFHSVSEIVFTGSICLREPLWPLKQITPSKNNFAHGGVFFRLIEFRFVEGGVCPM